MRWLTICGKFHCSLRVCCVFCLKWQVVCYFFSVWIGRYNLRVGVDNQNSIERCLLLSWLIFSFEVNCSFYAVGSQKIFSINRVTYGHWTDERNWWIDFFLIFLFHVFYLAPRRRFSSAETNLFWFGIEQRSTCSNCSRSTWKFDSTLAKFIWKIN